MNEILEQVSWNFMNNRNKIKNKTFSLFKRIHAEPFVLFSPSYVHLTLATSMLFWHTYLLTLWPHLYNRFCYVETFSYFGESVGVTYNHTLRHNTSIFNFWRYPSCEGKSIFLLLTLFCLTFSSLSEWTHCE